MCQVPFQLQYKLNRRQRLVPLWRIWGVAVTPFVVVMLIFFAVATVVSILFLRPWDVVLFGSLGVVTFFLYRELFVGLMDVVRFPLRKMDIVVELNAADILLGGERWRLFLDGITEMRKYRRDTWTIQFWNGTLLHIDGSAITEDQVGHLRAAMEHGRTAEGIQAVIERGRKMRRVIDGQ
jgi:hypothetical protein